MFLCWAFACYEHTESSQVVINEDNANDTGDFITKRLSAIKSQRSTGDLEDLALIIGQSFPYDPMCFLGAHI
jgi:hypothetical protein